MFGHITQYIPDYTSSAICRWSSSCRVVVTRVILTVWIVLLQAGFISGFMAQSHGLDGSSQPDTKPAEETFKNIETLLGQAEQMRQAGDYTAATACANEAYGKAKSTGNTKGIAHTQFVFGTIYYSQRNFAKASAHFLPALQIAKENKWQHLIAGNLGYLGAIHATEGMAEEGLAQASEALELFTQLTDQKGQANAHMQLGFIHRSQGRFEDALEHYKASYTLAEQTGFTWGMAAAQSAIGTVYGGRGQYDMALENFTSCMRLWQQLENKPWIADTYHHIGNIHFYRANYAEALAQYLTSLKLKQEIGDEAKIADSYHDIGHIYYKQGQHEEALLNYQKALNIFKKTGIRQRIGIAYSSIGNAYNDLGDIPKAVENYEASIALQQEIGDKAGLIYSYNNIAGLYIHQEDYEAARRKLMAALELGIELEELEGLSWSYQQLGALNLKTGHFQQAREHLEKSLSYCKQTGNKNIIMVDYSLFAKTDSAMGHFQHALIHYKLFKTYSDSLNSEEKARMIADLKINYETERKDMEIQRLEGEREIQQIRLKRQTSLKNYLAGSLILFALLSFFAYNYFVTRQKLKLQTLRNKIASDLHDDVGSTLSSIAIFSEIARTQSKEVMPLLQTIGDSSRKMLDAMTDIVWTINPENDQLENIILRMRSYAYELLGAKDIGFDFTADEHLAHIKLPMDVRRNLFLIFKEATNNIIKYSEAKKALFSINADRDHLSMVIRDNGKGFDVGKPTEGNGLKNMRKRAKEVGGHLRIDSFPGNGTTIELKISV